jgi:hypothetical protein
MGEVPAIGREPLDSGLASAKHALVVGVGADRMRILDDLIGQLAINRSTEPIHADLTTPFGPCQGASVNGGDCPARL